MNILLLGALFFTAAYFISALWGLYLSLRKKYKTKFKERVIPGDKITLSFKSDKADDTLLKACGLVKNVTITQVDSKSEVHYN